jgi:hypothetical protein
LVGVGAAMIIIRVASPSLAQPLCWLLAAG